MGFFDRVNRIWSGLDFWDKEENRRQRENFAWQDEEERRRRAREAASRGAVSYTQEGGGDEPNVPEYDPTSSLKKVGSQSDFRDDRNWFEKAGTTLGLSALRVGAGITQGVGGIYDLATPGKGQNRLTKWATKAAEDVDKTAKAEGLEKGYKIANVPLEIASYFTPGGAAKIASNVPKIATLGSKLTKFGDDVVENAADSSRLKKFGAEGVQEITRPKNIAQEIRLTNRYLGQDSARGEDIGAEDIALNAVAALGGGFVIPMIGKGLRKAPQFIKGAADEAEDAINNIRTPNEEAVTIPGTTLQKAPETQTPKIEVDDGVKSSNLAKADNEPAFMRNQQRQDSRNQAITEDVEQGPLSRPAYQHNQDIQNVIEQGQRELDDFVAANPNATRQQFEEAQQAIQDQVTKRVAQLQDSRYGAVNIPDAANPIALAKAGDGAPEPVSDQVVADFRNSVDAPLQKAEPETRPVPASEPTPADVAEAAARGELRVSTRTDAEGNPALVSDAQAGRELAEAGVVPPRGDSPVAVAEDQMAREAEITRNAEVNEEVSRVRQTITDSLDDPALRDDLLENFEGVRRVNLEESKNVAKQNLNSKSEEDLIVENRSGVNIDSPEKYFEAIGAIRRIQRIDTPEAKEAVSSILEALDNYKARGGQTLRVVRTLYEDMPTAMKQDYLIKKLDKLYGRGELQTADQRVLLSLVEASDDAMDNLRRLEDEASSIIESGAINNSSIADDVARRVDELPDQIMAAKREMEIRQGDAQQFYQKLVDASPEGGSPMGKRAGDVGRTLMLSSPAGRIFDLLSTGATSLDDTVTRGVSNLIGKGVNLQKAGRVSSTLPSPVRLVKGAAAGVRDTYDQFRGKDRVEDFFGEADRYTRGDINTGGGPFRRAVRSLVQLPTNVTRGIREEQLYRQGMQEAAQQGLKGKAARSYAELRASVPSKQQLHEATETWKKANMLHENGITRTLNGIANALDKRLGGWGAPFIRNQVAPFTSWLGGNLHRTLTDKNVLWNVGSAIKNASKGNAQGFIDDISKFAVNTGEAYAAGMLLTQAGVITTEDANGDDYAGLYINIGDRYIPVAILGTVATPLIMGNAVQQSMGGESDESFVNTLAKNIYKNTGVASVFGAENNLQSSVAKIGEGKFDEAAAQYGGDLIRQYIPGFLGEVNAMLDQTDLNPTREAAETKVTRENPETGRDKTDVFATELAKTFARIPGLAQGLPRREDTMAKDLLDRATRGNRQGEAMAQKQSDEDQREETAETLDERKASLEDRGYSVTEDGPRDAFDEGDYDWLIEYNKYKMDLEANSEDNKLTDNERKRYETEIKKLEIYRDVGDRELVTGYDKEKSKDGGVGVTAWREMMDSGDPELVKAAEKLAEIDEKMLDAGLIKDYKYYWLDKNRKKGSRGSRGGSGRGKKGPKFLTSIGTQSFSEGGGFQPLPEKAASFGAPQSAIPQLEKVPNYDKSKLKKISVTRGGRR